MNREKPYPHGVVGLSFWTKGKTQGFLIFAENRGILPFAFHSIKSNGSHLIDIRVNFKSPDRIAIRSTHSPAVWRVLFVCVACFSIFSFLV